MKKKNKRNILFAALFGLCSTVQAMENKNEQKQKTAGPGQEFIRSQCFSTMLEFMTLKEKMRLQVVNRELYENMGRHISSMPTNHQITVNGFCDNDRNYIEFDSGTEMDKIWKLENFHAPFRLSVAFVQRNDLMDIYEFLFPRLTSLRLDHIRLWSGNWELYDYGALREITLTNCTVHRFYAHQKKEIGKEYADEEKIHLHIGNAPALEKLEITEHPAEVRTIRLYINGDCPNLRCVALNTKDAQVGFEPFLQSVRKNILCKGGGTVHPDCIVDINAIEKQPQPPLRLSVSCKEQKENGIVTSLSEFCLHPRLESLRLDDPLLSSHTLRLDDLYLRAPSLSRLFPGLDKLRELTLNNCNYRSVKKKYPNTDQTNGKPFIFIKEKIFNLRIPNAPALEKLEITEDPKEPLTMKLSIDGPCPKLQCVKLYTKYAQETLEPFYATVRPSVICKEGGTAHRECKVYINDNDYNEYNAAY